MRQEEGKNKAEGGQNEDVLGGNGWEPAEGVKMFGL